MRALQHAGDALRRGGPERRDVIAAERPSVLVGERRSMKGCAAGPRRKCSGCIEEPGEAAERVICIAERDLAVRGQWRNG